MREVIERDLAAGMTLTEIHEKYREQFPVSYGRFRTHVSREITLTAGSRGGKVPKKGDLGLKPPQKDSTPQSPSPKALLQRRLISGGMAVGWVEAGSCRISRGGILRVKSCFGRCDGIAGMASATGISSR
jgi:hypothetical protein